MALVPNGDGDESGVGGGNWTDDDNIDSSSSTTTTTPPSLWRVGGANHPTFCVFKGFFDGLAGGFMGSVFGFGNLPLTHPQFGSFLHCIEGLKVINPFFDT